MEEEFQVSGSTSNIDPVTLCKSVTNEDPGNTEGDKSDGIEYEEDQKTDKRRRWPTEKAKQNLEEEIRRRQEKVNKSYEK